MVTTSSCLVAHAPLETIALGEEEAVTGCFGPSQIENSVQVVSLP